MEEDYPRTILELEYRFSDEGVCRDYLIQLRWPQGFVRPRCASASPAGRARALQDKSWFFSRSWITLVRLSYRPRTCATTSTATGNGFRTVERATCWASNPGPRLGLEPMTSWLTRTALEPGSHGQAKWLSTSLHRPRHIVYR